MKILILGHNGMLGHMVKKYMTHKNIEIQTTEYKWPSDEFKKFIKNSNSNYLINCIGCIPQKKPSWKDYKSVNIKLPLFLSENFNGKIIHPTTDCEFSGNLEINKLYKKNDIKDASDDYGISKSHAIFLLNKKNNIKIIRTSIIGPELNHKVSLFEWFLKQNNIVNGYKNYYWNGITTLEWAKQCYSLINNWRKYPSTSQIGTEKISKYDLLCLINKIFKTNKKIRPINTNIINKCLKSDFSVKSLQNQLIEMKNFYKNS